MNIIDKVKVLLKLNKAISETKIDIGGNNMGKIIEFLKGKKTYLTIGVGVAMAIAQGKYKIEIPLEAWGGLLTTILAMMKIGNNRTEETIKESVDNVKATADLTAQLIKQIEELKSQLNKKEEVK